MKLNFLCPILIIVTLAACQPSANEVVYQTDTLKIQQLTSNTFVHISYLQTESFGKVACNGMIYLNDGEVLIFDTPTTDEVSKELLAWIAKDLNAKVSGVVATHAHDDCLGGLSAFHDAGISSYANQLTQQLAREKNFPIPQHGFQDRLNLKLGDKDVVCAFVGQGHTRDNIVGYIPTEKVLFGGCLLKSQGAGKGYVGEANVEAWPKTVDKIKNSFTEIEYIVPGHGEPGSTELLDYTRDLFLEGK